MTRPSGLNSPLLLGFEQFERTLDRVAKSPADGYPPYNIEQIGAERLRITLAVAGFGAEDLAIQVEDSQLVIRGRQQEQADRVFLHRGIASRQFQRTFLLAEGIEVEGATLDNGLLHIELRRPIPASRARTIAISRRSSTSKAEPVDVASSRSESK